MEFTRGVKAAHSSNWRTVRLRDHSSVRGHCSVRGYPKPTEGKNMVKRREIRNGKAADEAMDGASQSEASAWTYTEAPGGRHRRRSRCGSRSSS